MQIHMGKCLPIFFNNTKNKHLKVAFLNFSKWWYNFCITFKVDEFCAFLQTILLSLLNLMSFQRSIRCVGHIKSHFPLLEIKILTGSQNSGFMVECFDFFFTKKRLDKKEEEELSPLLRVILPEKKMSALKVLLPCHHDAWRMINLVREKTLLW